MGAFLTFVGVVIAVVLWWRRFNRTHTTVMSALKTTKSALDKRTSQAKPRAQQQTRPPQQAETLEKDPKTGVYRVKGGD